MTGPTCDKRGYDSEAAAKGSMKAFRKRRRGKRDPRPVPTRAYQCLRCHRWHMTSEPKRDLNTRMRRT